MSGRIGALVHNEIGYILKRIYQRSYGMFISGNTGYFEQPNITLKFPFEWHFDQMTPGDIFQIKLFCNSIV